MLLTMEEIKAQLRLDEDFDADDRHLQLLACAAQKRTETYLNRKLYAPDETIPDSDPDGLHLPDDIRLGMLMLISHFYENRSSVTDVEKMELPMSFNWLVAPYRLIPLGKFVRRRPAQPGDALPGQREPAAHRYEENQGAGEIGRAHV